MPISERGYLTRIGAQARGEADAFLDAHQARIEVASNLAHLLDTYHQHIASAVNISGVQLVSHSGQGGAGEYLWAHTIGPFPLMTLPEDGRPAPVRVLVCISRSAGATTSFCRGVLRHPQWGAASPADSTGDPGAGYRDGWNIGIARTTSASRVWMELECVDAGLQGTDPLKGFLQFPPNLWDVRQSVAPASQRDADYHPASVVMAQIDLYLGATGAATTTRLWGYVAVACSYGLRTVST